MTVNTTDESHRHAYARKGGIGMARHYTRTAIEIGRAMPDATIDVIHEGHAGYAIYITTPEPDRRFFIATDWDGGWLLGRYENAEGDTDPMGFANVTPDDNLDVAPADAAVAIVNAIGSNATDRTPA